MDNVRGFIVRGLNNGLKPKEIAVLMDVSITWIYKLMKDHEIKKVWK